MTSPLLVNAEGLVSSFLRNNSAVTALCDDRIYTSLPARLDTWPAVRLTRVGGGPLFDYPLMLDQPLLQFDVWGGPKATAWRLAETIRMEIADNLPGDYIGYGRVYGGNSLMLGALRDLPDTTYDPAKPRYIFDITMLTRAVDYGPEESP